MPSLQCLLRLLPLWTPLARFAFVACGAPVGDFLLSMPPRSLSTDLPLPLGLCAQGVEGGIKCWRPDVYGRQSSQLLDRLPPTPYPFGWSLCLIVTLHLLAFLPRQTQPERRSDCPCYRGGGRRGGEAALRNPIFQNVAMPDIVGRWRPC